METRREKEENDGCYKYWIIGRPGREKVVTREKPNTSGENQGDDKLVVPGLGVLETQSHDIQTRRE